MDGDFARDLPAFDPEMAELVAIERIFDENRDEDLLLHVEQKRLTDPLISSWLRLCKLRGIKVKVVYAELDEIQALRQSGSRAKVASENVAGPESETGNLVLARATLKKASGWGITDMYVHRLGTHTFVLGTVKQSLRLLDRFTQEEGEALDRAYYTGLATSKSGSHSFLHFQEAEISGAEMEDIGLTSVRIVRGYSAPYSSNGGFMALRLQPNGNARPKIPRTEALPFPPIPKKPVDLGARGYDQSQVEKLLYFTEGTRGIVLFTGPTGSGKTTTLADLLRHTAIVAPDLRQVSIERPVEIPMPWAIQIPIIGDFSTREEEGRAIADVLRFVLRMNPKIISVNEIRVADVALLVTEIGRTGHKTYSSIHVDCPYEFAERIEQMDSSRLPKASFCNHKLIQGVVNQRLVPLLCDNCARPLSEAPEGYYTKRQWEALRSYGDLSKVRIRKKGGCKHCDFDGVTDNIAVAEIIVTDDALMHDLIHHGSKVARQNYRKRPGADPSILSRAMDLTLQGRFDLADVNKYLERVEPRERVNE